MPNIPIRIENMRNYKGKGIRIDRRSILGNPFPMKKESERNEVIKKYKDWLMDKSFDSPEWKEIKRLRKIYEEKGTLILKCWCSPKACHGEIIKNIIENEDWWA